jgi:hypothetical protein
VARLTVDTSTEPSVCWPIAYAVEAVRIISCRPVGARSAMVIVCSLANGSTVWAL